MKRLSIRCTQLLLLLALSSFTFRTADAAPKPSGPAYFYFFSYPEDAYNDYNDVNDEIYEMWLYYDAPVDEDPAGGTLIERGYYNNVQPHNQFAAVFLYAHFPY